MIKVAVIGEYSKCSAYFTKLGLVPDAFFVADKGGKRYVAEHSGTPDLDKYDEVVMADFE